MKSLLSVVLMFAVLPVAAQTVAPSPASHASERLGTVSFPVSCAPATQAKFNRGVALLHDFWYDEAQAQFQQIAQADPTCAMAHWGVAMSAFHQIWGRPSEQANQIGWAEIHTAESLPMPTARERAYIAALASFYRPGPAEYPARIAAYSADMKLVYARNPTDVDAGAFYALSLLASKTPGDTGLTHEQQAMAVLTPLFARYPDNPGVVHYIIHACDNPTMAAEGLTAANHYGQIAQSGAHAFHMPGHIYARLGMWPQDVASQLGSIRASEAAEAQGKSGLTDEPHSFDFLIYAYLQSGQDARARAALGRAEAVLTTIAAMPGAGSGHMAGMVPMYRAKLPIFLALETRDWSAAADFNPPAGASPHVATTVYWARAIGHGHLHQAAQARADLARYEALLAEVRHGKQAYLAEDTGTQVEHNEVLAWVAFAQNKQSEALRSMRAAADLQDKVGQAEVDIPAREMLADMLLEFKQPQQALSEYKVALKLSPNRLNGLYNAGRAAEAAGDNAAAKHYYAALLQSTGNGENSTRPEFAHAKTVLAAQTVAAR